MQTTANRFSSKENFTIYANAVINGYNAIIKTYETIKSVAIGMSGKVFNKRFVTAVETILGDEKIKTRLSVRDDYGLGYKTMYIYMEDRGVNVGGNWMYVDNDVYYTTIHNIDRNWLDDGRINAETICNHCDDSILRCQELIHKWQDAADYYDEYKKEVAEAVKNLGKELSKVNDLFKPSELHSFDWD